MSHTFDSLQQAIHFLATANSGNSQAQDVAYYAREIIDALHDISHQYGDWLNRGASLGRPLNLLDTALRHEDNEKRAMWIKIKEKEW